MPPDSPSENPINKHSCVIDFSDRLGKPAHVKELVLHVAHLEAELKRTGTIEITARTLGYISDRPVRDAVEKRMQGAPLTLTLNEQSLPVLLRASLLEAYLHERLSLALSSMSEIDLGLSRGQHKTVEEPIGTELRNEIAHYIRRAREYEAGEEVITQLSTILTEIDEHAATGVIPASLYQKVFDNIRVSSEQTSRGLTSGIDPTNALATIPERGLQAIHMGGSTELQSMMTAITRERPRMSDNAHEAQSNDIMRRMFSSPLAKKQYLVRTFSGTWYQNLPPYQQQFVNEIALGNSDDALCINKAQTLFPGTVAPEIASRFFFSSLLEGIFGAGETGLTSNQDGTYALNIDPKKSISSIAISMQSVLDKIAVTSQKQGLVVKEGGTDDIAADDRRARRPTFLGMFAVEQDEEDDCLPSQHAPITAHTLWEYLEVADPQTQCLLYEAFVRAHGKAYIGSGDDEGFVDLHMKLTRDGSVVCQRKDNVHGNDEEDELFSLFEAVNPDYYTHDGYEHARYARTTFFDPNIPHLVKSLRAEDDSFGPLLSRARAIEETACIRVDSSVLAGHNREVKSRVLGIRRKLELLKNFVTPEKEKWLSLLGLEALPTDAAGINKAYRKQVVDRKLHPDLHAQSHPDALHAANSLCELTHARNELLRCIDSTGKASMVSTYLGRPLDLISDVGN